MRFRGRSVGHFTLTSLMVGALFGCTTPIKHPSAAAGPPTTSDDVLPLERVRLYASGVGYFERTGSVSGTKSSLPVPTGHLDDALKTLVVFNSEQELGSVSFPSRLSPAVARARAGLPADQDAVLSYDRLLGSLRGEQVELVLRRSAPGPHEVRGRVIDVVAVQPSHPSYDHGPPHLKLEKGESIPEATERLQVLVLSEKGEILRLDAGDLSSVRALDDIVARRLHAALSARLATRSNQSQRLELTGVTSKTSKVTLAYLAEAPTWRASYRLLLEEAEPQAASRLQAWALVHNDTDEAWHGVRLELVDGRPNSFLFPITAPRYERRRLETPEYELSSVPQLSTTTPDALWGDFSDYEGEAVSRVGSDGISGIGEGGGGRGEGIGLGNISSLGHGSGAAKGYGGGSELLFAGDLARQAGVVPTAKQTTSVYRIAHPLDLAPQHSATVPFIDAKVTASSIVWFDSLSAPAARAVGFNNDTPNTLPAGPLAVYGRGGFLGEALLASLKPGERQFAQISDEPDTVLHSSEPSEVRDARHVDFRHGSLRIHAFVTSTRHLTFDNQSGRSRRAYVALPIVLNARLQGSEGVDYESTSARPFAVFELPPRMGHERTLVSVEAVSQNIPLASIEQEDLLEVVHTDSIPPAERDTLQKALPLLSAWQDSEKRDSELVVEIKATEEDLGRLRTHIKALGASEAESAHAQLVQRILEREDKLSTLRSKRRSLEHELGAKKNAFEVALSQLDQFRDSILAERAAAANAALR